VAQLLAREDRRFARRTELGTSDELRSEQFSRNEILLLDTVGELAGVFALADLVFMGGSLVPTGGHNVLEPAFWGKAIVFGPHMENFRDVAALFLNGSAAVQVHSASELGAAACGLLRDEPRRRRLGEAAKEILARQAGGTERILERLRPWLEKDPAAAPAAHLAGSRAK
jgi:3-deoxy-D-manno-octulosonic-acid transferase